MEQKSSFWKQDGETEITTILQFFIEKNQNSVHFRRFYLQKIDGILALDCNCHFKYPHESFDPETKFLWRSPYFL